MQQLIERLQKATEPDTDLDLAIGHWLWGVTNGGKPWECFDYGAGGPGRKFTSSIDCALTLLPKGATWLCGFSNHVTHTASVYIARRGFFDAEVDSSRAIAICIAALKARQSDNLTPAPTEK